MKVYGFMLLTIFIENSVLDAVGVLDPLLITSGLLMVSNKLIFCRLRKYKIICLWKRPQSWIKTGKLVSLREISFFNRSNYIMSSKGETRHSYLATFFNTFRKDGEYSKQSRQLPSKRKREKSENPMIPTNQTPTGWRNNQWRQ